MIRGKSYEECLIMLEFMPYRACEPVSEHPARRFLHIPTPETLGVPSGASSEKTGIQVSFKELIILFQHSKL